MKSVYFMNDHFWSSGGINCYGTVEAPTEFLLGLKLARQAAKGVPLIGRLDGGTQFIHACISTGFKRKK